MGTGAYGAGAFSGSFMGEGKTLSALTESGLTEKQLFVDFGLFHMVAAFALLPCYFYFGPEFKILIIPYVLYLLFSAKACYFPAILVHFMPGSVVSQAILIACAVLPLIHWEKLKRLQLHRLYVFAATPLSMVLLTGIYHFAFLGHAWLKVAGFLSYFLGFFAFFYGAVIAAHFDNVSMQRVLWVLLVPLLMQVAGLFDITIRYTFLTIPLFIMLSAAPFFIKGTAHFFRSILFYPVLFMALRAAGGLTFTGLSSALVGFGLLLGHSYAHGTLKRVPLTRFFAVGSVLILVYVTASISDLQDSKRAFVGAQSSSALHNLINEFQLKAFGDRGVLWRGTLEVLGREGTIYPPSTPPQVSYVTLDGALMEVTFGAHNVFLELVRIYGFGVGIAGIFVYLWIFSHVGRAFSSGKIDQSVALLGAALLGTGFMGGLVGQFVLMNNFSLLLMGLAGVFCGLTRRERPIDRGTCTPS